LGAFHLIPYLETSRNKFVFAHSKFSAGALQPSNSRAVITPINLLADDKKIDDLEQKSSFVIELRNKILIGVYDKEKSKYKISVY
jgi:hypothetical protein